MKYLFGALLFLYFLLMSAWAYGQQDEIYGLWYNQEGEFVEIDYNDTFNRFIVVPNNKKKIILARGSIKYIKKELRIFRSDTSDVYDLCYYLGNETMVICKPRSTQAWLWQKLK
tara:strand:- start:153 stop:494 length:342 start_codon:yes stop_codon:yes gene_type:complete